MEFQQIRDLIKNDQIITAERMLDEQIADASRQLASLETKEMKLNKEYKTCQKKLAESQKTNLQLKKNKDKILDCYDENNQGTFFIQLRRVEADIERCKMNIDGLKSVINNLKGEQAKSTALSSRLLSKLNELRSQRETVKNDETVKKNQLNILTNQLDEATVERDILEADVEELKIRLNELVDDIQAVTPIERDFLVTQRDTLQNEIKEKLKILDDMLNQEKSLNSKAQFSQVKRNRKFSSVASTSNWLSEREALIGKIKNLRTTVKNLETQQRGVEKTQIKNQETVVDSNFNAEETKLALICERLSVPTSLNDFFMKALEIEKSRNEKLKTKLEQIAKVTNQVTEFTAITSPIMKLNEDMVENTIRITLLRDELSSLRESTRK